MAGHGHALEFGYFLVPEAGDPQLRLPAEFAKAAATLHYALEGARPGPQPAHLLGPQKPDLLRTFIEDVAPDVRERVAAARAQAERVAATAVESSE